MEFIPLDEPPVDPATHGSMKRSPSLMCRAIDTNSINECGAKLEIHIALDRDIWVANVMMQGDGSSKIPLREDRSAPPSDLFQSQLLLF